MEQEIRRILEDNFAVPKGASPDTDLREYLEDSIDIGEFIAIINTELDCQMKLIDFRGVHSLNQVVSVVTKNNEA